MSTVHVSNQEVQRRHGWVNTRQKELHQVKEQRARRGQSGILVCIYTEPHEVVGEWMGGGWMLIR